MEPDYGNTILHEHPNLCNHIENWTSVIHGVEGAMEASMEPECNDKVDVPSSAVIEDAVGLKVLGADSAGSYCDLGRKASQQGGSYCEG
jgi:hypothetical protein